MGNFFDIKRIIYCSLIVLIFVITIYIAIEPLAIFFAEMQLRKTFPGSKVSVGSCDFKPIHLFAISDIEVSKSEIYDFKIKEIGIRFNIFSLFKRNISSCYLKDAVIIADLPQRSVLEIFRYPDSCSRRAFFIQSLELSDLNLNIKLKDLKLEARMSSELDLMKQSINYCDLNIAYLDSQGLNLENASLKVNNMENSGKLYISSLKYAKVKIGEVKSATRVKDKVLFLDSFSAGLWDGQVQGDLSFQAERNTQYSANLKFINLNLEKFVDDFNLKEKFTVTGRLSGHVNLQGRGAGINILNGDFSSDEKGGLLVIRDTKFLEKIAKNSKQSLDVVVQSFKDYNYNTGMMKLSMDKSNLIFDIFLDGQNGKRNLNIIMHDFNPSQILFWQN